MNLKFLKTIALMLVVVSASVLMVACNTKTTEPLKSMSGKGVALNQTMASSDNAAIAENYGVPQAQSVLFEKNAEDVSADLTF